MNAVNENIIGWNDVFEVMTSIEWYEENVICFSYREWQIMFQDIKFDTLLCI